MGRYDTKPTMAARLDHDGTGHQIFFALPEKRKNDAIQFPQSPGRDREHGSDVPHPGYGEGVGDESSAGVRKVAAFPRGDAPCDRVNTRAPIRFFQIPIANKRSQTLNLVRGPLERDGTVGTAPPTTQPQTLTFLQV